MTPIEQTFPVLQTNRLTLNQLLLSDTAKVVDLAGNEKIARMTLNIPHPYTEQDAEGWILASHDHFAAGTQYTFAIRKTESTELIGAIGLILTPKHQRAAAGYWMGEPFWNRGYTTEAVAAIIRFGFTELHLNKIDATHLLDNPASGKVMIKNGMVLEGELQEHYKKGEAYHSVKQYRILKREWGGCF